MRPFERLMGSALMMFASGAVHAQQVQTTAFDGTYAGVSMTLIEMTYQSHPNGNGHGAHWCPQFPYPGKLFISQGHAHTKWGSDPNGMYGDVDAQGGIVMRNGGRGSRLDGKIDASGKLTANGGGACQYHFVWQKQ